MPTRRTFRPTLEVLEDRLALSSTTPVQISTPQPPPSFFQTVMSLYIDGAEWALRANTGFPTSAVQANINAALPYAGPYGPLFVEAGALSVYTLVLQRGLL
jgi:hypothetical protein